MVGVDMIVRFDKLARYTRFQSFKPEKCIPSVLMLYCNFVSPSLLGGNMSRVLKVIPFVTSNGDNLLRFESQHYEFLPLDLCDNNLLHF